MPRLRPDIDQVPRYRPGRAGERGSDGPAVVFACASNENPYPPLPSVVEAIAAEAGTVNRYPDMACASLTEGIADYLSVPAEDVVLGPGSVGVLQQVLTAVVAAGDEVVFAWRSFEAYPIVTHVAGATPVPVAVTATGHHDVDAMVAAVSDRTRLVVVCTPNNPTGTTVDAVDLDRLLAAVPDDVVVVVDEAYAEFVHDPSAADGLAAYRTRPNVVVLRTFSKAYGLAGLRVGYGVAHGPVASAMRATGIPFGVSSVAQAAALESLRHRAELLARVDAVVTERERVTAALTRLGWHLPPSQGNFVWFGVGERSAGLTEALAQAGLAVRTFPGEGVRVTIAEPEANDRLIAVATSLKP